MWHGAAWSFAVWGLWHGVGLAIERPLVNSAFYRSQDKRIAALRMLFVFAFVSAGWLLFKIPVFSEALGYLHAIRDNWSIQVNAVAAFLIVLYSIPVVVYHAVHLAPPRWSPRMLPVAQAAMVFMITLNSGPQVPFVYFQF